jgi:hypothetical protein
MRRTSVFSPAQVSKVCQGNVRAAELGAAAAGNARNASGSSKNADFARGRLRRCDTYPRFSPDGSNAVIDSAHGDSVRRIYLIEIEDLVRQARPV